MNYYKIIRSLRTKLIIISLISGGQLIAQNNLIDSFNAYIYSDIKKAKVFSDRYTDIVSKGGDKSAIAESFKLKGIYHNILGNTDASINNSLKSLQIYESLKDSLNMAKVTNNIGAAYNNRKDPVKTIEFYTKALDIFTKVKDTLWVSKVLYNLSTQENALGNYQEDLNYKNKALNLLKYKPNPGLESVIEANIAHSYLKTGQLEKARTTIEKFLKSPNAETNLAVKSNAEITYAMILQEEKQYDAAIDALNRSLAISKKEGLGEKEMKAYDHLSEIYQLKGDYKSALKFHHTYHDQYMTYFNEEKDRVIESELIKYDSEKKENQIQLLASQNQIKDLSIKKSSTERIYFILGIVIAVLITLILIRTRKIITDKNNELSKNNLIISKALDEKNILLKEIHHRVKNNLQVISSLLKLQSHYIKDEQAIRAFSDGRNRVHSMALLHQNLYSEDDLTGVQIKKYFENLIDGLFDAYNIKPDSIKLEKDIDDLNLDVDTVIPLGLITNEMISNALKHAFEGQENAVLKVSLKENIEVLYLEISDNGKGMKEETFNSNNSFGQKLIKTLAEKLNATLTISHEGGTTFSLKIKEYQKTKRA